MKKFLIFSILLTFLVSAYADAQKSKTMTANDKSGSWLLDKSFGSSDIIGAGDSTWYYTVIPNKGERLYYEAKISLDSTGGTGGIADLVPVLLQGRNLSTDDWTTITTTNWIGSTADTTIKFTQVTTAQFYTEYRVSITAANDSFAAKINRLIMRFWY